jgi:hypothetical protein
MNWYLDPGITVLRKLGHGEQKPSALLELTALELRVLLVWRGNRQSELNYHKSVGLGAERENASPRSDFF